MNLEFDAVLPRREGARARRGGPAGADEAAALAIPKVAAEIAGRTPKKVIVVKGRLVNVIV